jgi:4,5-DOPA dioxygenase extradiol
VQLSLNAFKGLDHHLDLGARLAPLRDQGVLIVGSGNIVHNLNVIDFRSRDVGFDWAQRFDASARDILLSDPTGIATLDGHPDFGNAVPTPDHYLPMLYIAGLADATPLDLLVDGHVGGSISMAAYTLGLRQPIVGATDSADAAPLLDIPISESNI